MKMNGRFAVLLLSALGIMASSGAADAQTPLVGARDVQPSKATLAIVGGMLIDGHEGPPLHHAIVLIDGNKIVAVGNRDTLKVPTGTKIVDAAGMTVMPGLIDAHVHHDILGHTDYDRWTKLYESIIRRHHPRQREPHDHERCDHCHRHLWPTGAADRDAPARRPR